jgi:hypothetical protein
MKYSQRPFLLYEDPGAKQKWRRQYLPAVHPFERIMKDATREGRNRKYDG